MLLLIMLSLPSYGCGKQKTFGDLDKELGVDRICEILLRGDYLAASESIKGKTASRKLTFAAVINWLSREVKSPYVEIPRSQLFQELPRDQGNPVSCRGGGLTLTGDQIFKPLHLQYTQARLTVMLRYSNPAAPLLQFIEIGDIEKIFPGQKPPEAFEKGVADLKRTLNEMESGEK